MPRNTKRHYRREDQEAQLDITTFLNLMVVLIPFLLVTAVFSRITIQELNLPTEAAGGSKQDRPQIAIEVIIRKGKIQLSDGSKIIATLKNVDGEYNIPKLSGRLLTLKKRHPEIMEATMLVEPDIEYNDIIHVMDAVKVAEKKRPDNEELVDRTVLFPQISLGDAP